MIQAWFNERGFYIRGPDGCSKYTYDIPQDVMDNAGLLYEFRWGVASDMLDIIATLWDESQGQDLALYTDSRLVEELQGEIEPTTTFARASRRYFNINDRPIFRRVRIEKCPRSVIEGKLNEQAVLEPGPPRVAKDGR